MITKNGDRITIVLEGIEGGQKFNPTNFPPNKLNLSNQTKLAPTQDMPWFGLKKDKKFSIFFDGKIVRAGGLSWDVNQIIEEIEAGYWKVV